MSSSKSTPSAGHNTTGGSGPSRATAGGVFDDYNFRFSNTYTIVEPQGRNHNNSSSGLSASPSSTLRGQARTPRRSGPSAFASAAPMSDSQPAAGTLPLTGSLREGVRGQDGQKQLRQSKSEKQTAAIMRYAHARKPQVTPSFVAAKTVAATGSAAADACISSITATATAMTAVGTGTYKPTGRPLLAPALGLAAGVEGGIMGEESKVFALTSTEQQDIMAAERAANEQLFRWWDERAAARSTMRFQAKLESTLQVTLESNAKDLIAKEETFWMETLCGGAARLPGTAAAVNPELKNGLLATLSRAATPTTAGNSCVDMMAWNNGLSRAGATAGGMVVPLLNLKMLFSALRAMLHERASTLLRTYEESQWAAIHAFAPDAIGAFLSRTEGEQAELAADKKEDGAPSAHPYDVQQQQLAQQACRAYVARLYETERGLAKEALHAAATTTSAIAEASLTPACVSLPPDRMLQPLMALETATSVALLGKVLEQARTVIPGMDFALQLYRHYLLPHLYEHYAAFDGVLPHQMGSLCDQVSRLCGLPLRVRAQLLAADALQESKEDVRYMEFAMKKWAIRTWRKSVADRHRQETALAACTSMLSRAARRAALRDSFSAWRLRAREGAYAAFMQHVRESFRQFLASSALSTRMDCIADTWQPLSTHLTNDSTGGDTTTGAGVRDLLSPQGRARLVAVQLAETATHRKPTGAATAKRSAANARKASARGDGGERSSLGWRVGGNGRLLPAITGSASDPGRAGTEGGGARGPALARTTRVPVSDPTLERGVANAGASNKMDGAHTAKDESRCTDSGACPPGLAGAGVFEEMLSRLREADEVCGHLRSEIAVQKRMIQRLEQEKRGLQDRNRTLEADLVRTVEEKLHYCNVVQEKQFQIQDRDRRITQLKSRLRAHRHRPWQRTVMRVIGEMCGASTQHAEALDDFRMRRDLRSDPKSLTEVSGPDGSGQQRDGFSHAVDDGAGDEVPLGATIEDGPEAREAEQERLFGELAPIVLSSTRQLPDALVILQDWANSCLDDLQSLDDLKGGALSVRFSSFSEEARSGVLLSRLLFYLALPRYLQRTAANSADDGGGGAAAAAAAAESGVSGNGGPSGPSDGAPRDGSEGHLSGDYADRRRQLLEQRNVQLDSPFPVYSECFGDLLSLRPSERMTLLLQFATQLVAGNELPVSAALAVKRRGVEEVVYAASDLTPPLAASRIALQEVVDPHALATGERSAVVTLMALLYVRFAHPFQHKSRQGAEWERAAMLCLLGGGGDDGPRGPAAAAAGGAATAANAAPPTVEEELLANLEDEDKSPWQLFKERCLPVFGSSAHPFLLRGNFWPSRAFDSPALVSLLGNLGAALNRSLQMHRWHVTLCCLVPVVTYAGMSRAVFTGPRASPTALRVGLMREGQWEFPLHSPLLRHLSERRFRGAQKRKQQVQRPVSPPLSVDNGGSASCDAHWQREKAELMTAISLASEDLLTLFLKHATLSAELALPVLDLSGWRLLCGDLAIVDMELGQEDQYPMALDVATRIFFEAIAALDKAMERPPLLAAPPWASAAASPDAVSASSAMDSVAGALCNALPQRASALSLEGAADSECGGQGAGAGGSMGLSPMMAPITNETLAVMRQPSAGAAVTTAKRSRQSPQQLLQPLEPFVPLPMTRLDMTFTAFMTAMVLIADALYPPEREAHAKSPVAAGMEEQEQHSAPWLGDALTALMRDYVLRSPAGNVLMDEPRTVIRRLQMGAATQEVLTLYTPALTLIYDAYSKDVYGSAGMEKEDLLQLLRDAMLTSTEISPYLVFELFQYCCVTRKSGEEAAAAKRREIDSRPRMPGERGFIGGSGRERRLGGRAVSILDPHADANSAAGKRKDIQVLVLQGFIEFLCVLCHFKQPNPLIPVHQRLDVFLRRSVLRPLNRKVEGITPFLNQLKLARSAQGVPQERRPSGGH